MAHECIIPKKEIIVPVLLNKVYDLIYGKFDKEQGDMVKSLADAFLSPVSDQDLHQHTESDLYGAVVSIWHTLNAIKQDQVSIKVFNPSLSQHGWKSTHTIIEIVCPDRPFLVDSI